MAYLKTVFSNVKVLFFVGNNFLGGATSPSAKGGQAG